MCSKWQDCPPPEAMWIIAWIPAKDVGGYSQQLWFNPASIDKYYLGSTAYCIGSKSVAWTGNPPTHWIPVPEYTENTVNPLTALKDIESFCKSRKELVTNDFMKAAFRDVLFLVRQHIHNLKDN
jgi:hypothetical protein